MEGGPLLKVQIRGGFSDRNNIASINRTIQYDALDDRTRIMLINTISGLYRNTFVGDSDYTGRNGFWDAVLIHVYLQRVDWTSERRYYDESKMLDVITATIASDSYDAVLSLIEFVCRYFEQYSTQHYRADSTIFQDVNKVLEKEFVGYRFVKGYIAAITNSSEILEIEEAGRIKKNKVDQHIDKSLELLSDRMHPDYENSIKESISAVEAMCCEIVGKKVTLGEALNKLANNGVTIHPALKKAFAQLYGYTSDASGIRHAGEIGGPDSTFEEAKYMLVTCTAFINYLRGIESKMKLRGEE